jgi:hypothetical protein
MGAQAGGVAWWPFCAWGRIGAEEAEEKVKILQMCANGHFRSSLFRFLPFMSLDFPQGKCWELTPRQVPPPLASHPPVPSPAAQLAQAAEAAQRSHSPAGADNGIVRDGLDLNNSSLRAVLELNTCSLRLSAGSFARHSLANFLFCAPFI